MKGKEGGELEGKERGGWWEVEGGDLVGQY